MEESYSKELSLKKPISVIHTTLTYGMITHAHMIAVGWQGRRRVDWNRATAGHVYRCGDVNVACIDRKCLVYNLHGGVRYARRNERGIV